jgi:hypothetical protein
VAQGVGPEFKPQYQGEKKKKFNINIILFSAMLPYLISPSHLMSVSVLEFVCFFETGSCSIAQVGFQLTIFLPQPP